MASLTVAIRVVDPPWSTCATADARGHRSTVASMVSRWAELVWSRLPVPTCLRPGVRSGSVPRNASRLPPAPRSGRIRASGRIRCTRMHFLLPEARILPADAALADERARCAAGGSPERSQVHRGFDDQPAGGPDAGGVGVAPSTGRGWRGAVGADADRLIAVGRIRHDAGRVRPALVMLVDVDQDDAGWRRGCTTES